MNCQNCGESVETGAEYCGNCGHPMHAPQTTGVSDTVPAYALATPARHAGETKALMSLLLGVMGIVGALFMAMVGLVLGFAGLILGSLSRNSAKRGLSTLGIVFSSLAITVGLAVWVYAIQHDPRYNSKVTRAQSAGTSATVGSDVSTPCYSASFIDKLNLNGNAVSCNLNAFNGQTLETSTNAYKVYASQSQISNANQFVGQAKAAIEKDVGSSLTGFKIDSQKVATFAGSPAYIVNVSDKTHGVALVEAAVLHEVATGDNIFILVHANSGASADLQILESQWQWK